MSELVINKIVATLEKNGFPANKVRLSKDSLEKLCQENSCSLREIVTQLKDKKIQVETLDDKVVFSMLITDNLFDPSLLEELAKMDSDKLMGMAQKFMSSLSSDKMEEIKKQYDNLDEKTKEEILKKTQDWTPPKE